MRNILIIGGSGMLKDVCQYFLNKNAGVTVYSRTKSKMRSSRLQCDWLQGDYTEEQFRDHMMVYIERFSPSDVVIWMHQSGQDNLYCLLRLLESQPVKVHHIKGTKGSDDFTERDLFDLDYHLYVLGYGNLSRSRWMTNTEISDGIIGAIESGESYVKVGY